MPLPCANHSTLFSHIKGLIYPHCNYLFYSSLSPTKREVILSGNRFTLLYPHIVKLQSPNYRSLISSNATERKQKVLLCHSNMPETLSLGQIVVKLMSKLLSIQEVVTIRNTLHRCEFCLFWAKPHKRAKSNFLFLDHNIPLFMENNCTASPKICNFW